MEITLKAEGWTEQKIAEYVTEKVWERINDRVQREIEDAVGTAVLKKIDDLAAEQIASMVSAAVTEGWQETNNYGEPTGKTLTLKARIAAMLTKQVGSYDRRETFVEKIAKDTIEQALRKDFAKELEAAKEAFSKQVNATIQTRLAETLRSALGLR